MRSHCQGALIPLWLYLAKLWVFCNSKAHLRVRSSSFDCDEGFHTFFQDGSDAGDRRVDCSDCLGHTGDKDMVDGRPLVEEEKVSAGN